MHLWRTTPPPNNFVAGQTDRGIAPPEVLQNAKMLDRVDLAIGDVKMDSPHCDEESLGMAEKNFWERRRTLFRREIDVYLSCFSLRIGQFTDFDAAGQENPAMRGQMFAILRAESKVPRDDTWAGVDGRLQRMYDDEIDRIEKHQEAPTNKRAAVEKLHLKLVKSRVPFLDWPKDAVYGVRMHVSPRKLQDLYERSRVLRKSILDILRGILQRDRRVDRDTTTIDVVSNDTNLTPRDVLELMQYLLGMLSEREQTEALSLLGGGGIVGATSECTTIRIEVPQATADRLLDAFRAGRLRGDIVMVREVEVIGRTIFEPRRPDDLDDEPALERSFRSSWRYIQFRRAFGEPFRWLRSLMSLNVAVSPLAHVIRDSDNRAYATKNLLVKHAAAWGADMAVAWLLWPILTVLLLTATLLPLRFFLPSISISDGILSGVVLAISGGQICGFVVAPIAAGAGALFIGWAFGLAEAIIIGQIGHPNSLADAASGTDFFKGVNGGPIGLSAHEWPSHIPPTMIVLMLAAIAAAIAASGWFMAQPIKAGPFSPPKWPEGMRVLRALGSSPRGIEITGGIFGSLVGLFIGVTFALNALLDKMGLSTATAFSLTYGVVGGTVFGTTIWLAKKRALGGAALYAAAYFIFAFALCQVAGHAESTLGLIALSALTAVYQATWFTGAFVVGAQFSSRSAVIATTLEGAVGFTVYTILRLVAII